MNASQSCPLEHESYPTTAGNTPGSTTSSMTVGNTPCLLMGSPTECNTPCSTSAYPPDDRSETMSLPDDRSDTTSLSTAAPWMSCPGKITLLETAPAPLPQPLKYKPLTAGVYFDIGNQKVKVERLQWVSIKTQWRLLGEGEQEPWYKSLDEYIGKCIHPEGDRHWIEMEMWDGKNLSIIVAKPGVPVDRVDAWVPDETLDKLSRGHDVWIQYHQAP